MSNTPAFKSVGFLGLGVMGASMATHLASQFPKVALHSRTASKVPSSLTSLSNTVYYNSVADLMTTAQPEVLVSCLGYPKDVKQVYLEQILPNVQKGTILVDCTTSEADLAAEIAEKSKALGVDVLDCPVSGGDIGARNGTLTAFVGGEEAVLEKVRPVLDCFCKSVNYFGPAGAGQHAKAANQVFIATQMIGVVEGMLYAYRAGLDAEKVIQACSQGAANSFSMTAYGPRILKRDMEPGFYIEHFVKDMKIALDACERMSLDLPGLKLAKQLYDSLVEDNHGKKGTQALILALEKMNNIELNNEKNKRQ